VASLRHGGNVVDKGRRCDARGHVGLRGSGEVEHGVVQRRLLGEGPVGGSG
jgi:hypothetical protein